jgi:uncharacterized protein
MEPAFHHMNRRTFIGSSALGALGLAIPAQGSTYRSITSEQLPHIKEYRLLGRTGARVSDIGSGVPYAETVLKAVIDTGVNFIETAESYSNGNNEILIGNVISKIERERLFLATKINISLGLNTSAEDICARANQSLKRLNTPYVDLYMMHQAQSVVRVADDSFHNACDRLVKQGKIRFRGLSCHGTFWWQEPGGTLEEILMAAIEDGRHDVLFFPYNFLEPDMGERILRACKTRNIGTMIMKSNPVSVFSNYESVLQRGGDLGLLEQKDYEKKKRQMEQAGDFFRQYQLTDREKLERGAYQYILGNQDVSTICCRFRNFTDIEKYISLSGTSLDQPMAELLSDFRSKLGFLNCRIGCNRCEKNCPDHVPVSDILRYYYHAQTLQEKESAAGCYRGITAMQKNPCLCCPGHCENACPYHVAVRDLLADARYLLGPAVFPV